MRSFCFCVGRAAAIAIRQLCTSYQFKLAEYVTTSELLLLIVVGVSDIKDYLHYQRQGHVEHGLPGPRYL